MADLPKFQQQQYDFAAHIRDPQISAAPEGIEDRRMAIYRELFYNNMESFVARSFPVLRKIYSDESWHLMIRDFFSNHHSSTPYFLEIPKEFLTYLQNERNSQTDPPFLQELAHYEWAELAVSVLEDDINTIKVNRDGDLIDGIPLLSPTAWSLAYTFPVHQIKPQFQPHTPGKVHTFIVVYRDRQDGVGFIEINPITARLIESLEQNDSLSGGELLQNIAIEIKHPNPPTVIEGGREIMLNLAKHDIILGTKF